jgi:hypothetical protein
MFKMLRYGLMPVVFFCSVVVVSCVHIVWTNSIHRSTWPQTVVTVLKSQDFGQVLAEFQHRENSFPDPRGTGTYVIGGKTYAWQGRGRDIGVTVMKPGDQIKVHYNPQNPQEIGTLELLGMFTGSIIFAVALAFLAFYVWFFWLREFLRRSGSDDFYGDAPGSFADRLPEQPRSTPPINDRPVARSVAPGRAVTFGRR